MLVLGINYACGWVQITTGSGRYTCPMEKRNGELYFRFKNKWHSVKEYASDSLKASNYNGLGYNDYYKKH